MPSAVTRWDPFSELGDLRARFNRMFEDMGEGREGAWLPAVDIVRDDDNLVIKADIPGVDPNAIAAKTRDGVLEVTVPLPSTAKKEPIQITPTAG